MKLVTRDLHLMPLKICDFRENRYDDSRTIVSGMNEILLVLSTFFVSILIKFSTENFQNSFLINVTFRENCCWETNSFVAAVKGINCVCESSKPRGNVSVLRCIARSLVAFPCLLTLLPFSLSLL